MKSSELLERTQKRLNIRLSEHLEKGINLLLSIIDSNSNLNDDIYEMRGKYFEIKHDSENGNISYEEKINYSSKIRVGLLNIIDNLTINDFSEESEFWSEEEKSILINSMVNRKSDLRKSFSTLPGEQTIELSPIKTETTQKPTIPQTFTIDDLELIKAKHAKLLTYYSVVYRDISALVFRRSTENERITQIVNDFNANIDTLQEFKDLLIELKSKERELNELDKREYYNVLLRRMVDFKSRLKADSIQEVKNKLPELKEIKLEIQNENSPDSTDPDPQITTSPEQDHTISAAQQATDDLLTNILFLSANPKNTSQLRLGEELRKIKDSLAASTYRNKFSLVSESAIRVPTMTKAFQQQRPEIVHFAGHGIGEEGIIVENDVGDIVKFPTSGLDLLFKLFSKQVKCVVLNACYSKEQAEVISQHGIYVIGMNKAIGDKAALDFSVGFYQSLGEGNSFQFAYNMAMVNNSVNKRDAETPELWYNGKLISQ